MNTRRARKFELRRRKREFGRSQGQQRHYRALKDLVGQAHDTFQALRRNMAVERNVPLWATRRRNLRRLNQSQRAARKTAEAEHGRNKYL